MGYCGIVDGQEVKLSFRGFTSAASENGGDSTQTAGDVWSAFPILCDYLCANTGTLGLGSALELGCGASGACAITLAAIVPNQNIVLSDIDSGALECARENAVRNGVSAERVSTLRLDWEDESYSGNRITSLDGFDLVLGSDVVYVSKLAGPLARVIRRALKPSGVALIAHQIRRAVFWSKEEDKVVQAETDEALEKFLQALKSENLRYDVLDKRRPPDGSDSVLLLRIQKP